MTDATTTGGRTPLSEYPLDQLYAEAEGVKRVVEDFKTRAGLIQAEIEKRVAPFVAGALASSDKAYGVFHADIDSRVSVKIDVTKKVDWDSAKLQAVAQTLPWERVKAIFKIDFAVPEKIYAGIAAASPELATAIDAARTVKYGAPKVTLVVSEPAS